MLLRTALLVVAASAQQQAYVDPHGAAGEPLAGDLNGDGVLDEYELRQIEQATKSLTESFRAQVRQQLASQYVAQKTGGSKLADSRIASQAAGLQFAAANNQLEVVARLLASGADPNANHPSGMGLTPLHAAVEGGHKDLVDLLLEHNATIDARASDGSTPLHVAARKGHAAVAELLLRYGAPVSAAAAGGLAPLHHAAEMGHSVVVQYLLAANASADARAQDGSTPLHFAAREGHAWVVEALLDAGAEADPQDESSTRPLLWAHAAGHDEVARLLLEAGAAEVQPEEEENPRLRGPKVKVGVQSTSFMVEG